VTTLVARVDRVSTLVFLGLCPGVHRSSPPGFSSQTRIGSPRLRDCCRTCSALIGFRYRTTISSLRPARVVAEHSSRASFLPLIFRTCRRRAAQAQRKAGKLALVLGKIKLFGSIRRDHRHGHQRQHEPSASPCWLVRRDVGSAGRPARGNCLRSVSSLLMFVHQGGYGDTRDERESSNRADGPWQAEEIGNETG
jgi:hypothetical protein